MDNTTQQQVTVESICASSVYPSIPNQKCTCKRLEEPLHQLQFNFVIFGHHVLQFSHSDFKLNQVMFGEVETEKEEPSLCCKQFIHALLSVTMATATFCLHLAVYTNISNKHYCVLEDRYAVWVQHKCTYHFYDKVRVCCNRSVHILGCFETTGHSEERWDKMQATK